MIRIALAHKIHQRGAGIAAVNHPDAVGCGACATACKMGVDPAKSPNHCECIRCGACMSACPHDALDYCVSFSTSRSISSSDMPPQRR